MTGRRNCKNGNRSKPRKALNRYDPATPDYKAVHGVKTLPLPGVYRGRHVAVKRGHD